MKKKKNKTKWLLRDALLSSIFSLIAFGLISASLWSTSYFNPLIHTLKDFSFLDIFYQGSFSIDQEVSSEIVLINVENLSREDLAHLIETVHIEEPSAIGVDVIFKEKRTGAGDALLAGALSSSKAVTTYINDVERQIGNAAIFKSAQEISGFVNFDAEGHTGVVRKIQGVQYHDGEPLFSFTSQLVKNHKNGILWKQQDLAKKLGRKRRIKYYGDYRVFSHYSASDFLKLNDRSAIHKKIVLLGYLGKPLGNVYDVEDKHFTPLNTSPSGKGIPDMYGLTVHANILNMILLDDFFLEMGSIGEGLLIFLFAYLASLYFIWLDRKLKISYRTVRKLVLFVFAFLFIGLCIWLFGHNMVIEPTLIVMSTIFSAGFVKYYKHLVRYVKTKRKFKSYLK